MNQVFINPPGEQIYAHLQGYSIKALVNKWLQIIQNQTDWINNHSDAFVSSHSHKQHK